MLMLCLLCYVHCTRISAQQGGMLDELSQILRRRSLDLPSESPPTKPVQAASVPAPEGT